MSQADLLRRTAHLILDAAVVDQDDAVALAGLRQQLRDDHLVGPGCESVALVGAAFMLVRALLVAYGADSHKGRGLLGASLHDVIDQQFPAG